MMRVSISGAICLCISLAVASFGLGSYWGASYMMINDKLNWCYQWAHNHEWELTQRAYMDALKWCDDMHRKGSF